MIKSKIGDSLYVKSLKIGESIVTDYESGFFVHPNKQVGFRMPKSFPYQIILYLKVDEVCNQLLNDPKLQNGYNGLGFSQGGQFL